MTNDIFEGSDWIDIVPNGDSFFLSVKFMRISTSNLILPAMVPSFPEKFLTAIGAVLHSWSNFEIEFDILFDKLRKLTGRYENWTGLQFSERLPKIIEMIRVQFGQSDLGEKTKEVMLSANQMLRDRNLLSHGQMEFSFQIDGISGPDDIDKAVGTVCVKGKTRKGIVEKFYTLNDFSILFYRLSNLSQSLRDINNGLASQE